MREFNSETTSFSARLSGDEIFITLHDADGDYAAGFIAKKDAAELGRYLIQLAESADAQ